MPGPDETAPATSPDKVGNVYGIDEQQEREMKGGSADELRSTWYDIVDVIVGNGGTPAPYVSPTGDTQFEARVNALINQRLVDINAAAGAGVADAYSHKRADTASPKPKQNVAKAADPVSLFNGELTYAATDFQLNGAGFDFAFVRSYSQFSDYEGPLGVAWDHAYNLWIRVRFAGDVLIRSDGALREQIYLRHQIHDYWLPPDGVHDVIVESGDSYAMLAPDGGKIHYAPHPNLGPEIHVATRIEDRFGNFLDLLYADGRLDRVVINHPERVVFFDYDSIGRIVRIRDFTGRAWHYDYDDLGNLAYVTTPPPGTHGTGLVTSYEYWGVARYFDRRLRHGLKSIIDGDGRLYLENEYGTDPGLLSFGRVVRQRQGGGYLTFEYSNVVDEPDFPYESHERPEHQTVVTERDGRPIRYLFNRFGNMVFQQEYARLGGIPKLVSWHYRYNRDGALVASVSPLGATTQVLTGRDLYERRVPRDPDYRPELDEQLTLAERQAFPDVLAVVNRGRYRQFVGPGLWALTQLPDVLAASDDDIVHKYTYESSFRQLLSASDPRVTTSPNPEHTESSEYDRRLTRYRYGTSTAGHFVLAAIERPTPTLPDGTPADPVRTRFVDYDAKGRVVELAAPNGLITKHQYFPESSGPLAGLLQSTTLDPEGEPIRFELERDLLGRITQWRSPNSFTAGDGRFVTSYEYDALGRLRQRTGTPPSAVQTSYRYDRVGNLVGSEMELKDEHDALTGSAQSLRRYDEEAHLIAERIQEADGPQHKTTKLLHDRAGRPFLVIGPSGRKKKVYFDERGLPGKTVEDYGRIHATTRSRYDADARLSRIENARGFATHLRHDVFGRLVDEEDALGNRVLRSYDKLGNIVCERHFEKVDEHELTLLRRTEYEYDELGRLIRRSDSDFELPPTVPSTEIDSAFLQSGPGVARTRELFYDSTGNAVRVVDADGRELATIYDQFGRAQRQIDPAGNEVRYRYDNEGNVTRIDRLERSDPSEPTALPERHFARALSYDELGRLTESRTVTSRMRYAYDSRSNRVRAVDPLGNEVTNVFDFFGRVREQHRTLRRFEPNETPTEVVVAATYDDDDQLVSLSDFLGRTTTFSYDTLGRRTSTVLPDGSSDSALFDRAGNLVEYRDRGGRVRSLVWDALNRNVELRVAPAPADTEEAVGSSYQLQRYDALGRLTRVETDSVISEQRYDSLGRLREEATAFSASTAIDPGRRFVTLREFTNRGAVSKLTYPSGRQIAFDRDALDRVVRIRQVARGEGYPGNDGLPEQRLMVELGYEGLSPKRVTRENGLTTELSYDFDARLIQMTHRMGSSEVQTSQLLYDAAGNLRTRLELGAERTAAESFSYDSLHRLISVRQSSTLTLFDASALAPTQPVPDEIIDRQPEISALFLVGDTLARDYTYDAVGNRLSSSSGSDVRDYHPNALDQYESVAGEQLSYDANGCLKEDDRHSYRYDHRSQLVLVQRKADDDRVQYRYDGFGRRVLTEGAAGAFVHVYDGRTPLEEYRAGEPSYSVVSDGRQDGLLGVAAAGHEYSVVSDQTESIRFVFEGATQRAFLAYDEFGNVVQEQGSADDVPFRFAGKQLLADTDKYDFAFRTYDPRLGRFAQRDPRAFADGTNPYRFVRDNPLALSDALGEESRAEQKTAPVAARLGRELANRNPKGFTLSVSNNFDDAKIKAYRQRIQDPLDRGVGIRSRLPGQRTSTQDIRRANQNLRDDFEASLPGGQRPNGTDIDHTVELQHINRQNPDHFAPGANTVRPQDHRVQDSSLNSSQGSQAQKAKARQVRDGAPLDTPAGGVARERDLGKFRNSTTYRGVKRAFGLYTNIGGLGQSLSDFHDDIENGNWFGAALNGSGFTGGALELGGALARSTTLLRYGRVLGAPAAVVGSGLVGIRIGTNLYENYVDHEQAMSAGHWVEDKTGSRILGGIAAAGWAVGDAIASTPEAAVDYAKETWTLDPDEIDWGRTVRPWKWF